MRYAIVLLLLAGCAPQRPRAAAPSVAGAYAPAHADWARLKLLRNYLRLVRVGPQAHHFTVWYHHIEPCVCDAIAVDGRVELHDCMFGGLAVRPQTVTPIPRELQPVADAIWRRVHDKEPEASDPLVSYHGEYREVTFAEDIPLSDRYASGLVATLTLASDAQLSRWTRVVGHMSGFGALCGLPGDASCSDAPRWIRFDAPPRGQSLLMPLRKKLEQGSVDGDALAGALLHAARTQAGVPLEALGDGDTLLPEGLEQRLQAVVEIWGMRANRGGAAATARMLLPLDARDLARGDAHAEAHLDVAGRGFDVSFVLRGEPATTSGDALREMTMRVRDSEGHSFGWIFPAKAHLFVDGERAAAMSVDIQYPRSPSGPLRPEQDLPGARDIEQFLVHLDPELRPVWRDEP
jgi:hypothetical protein